MNTIYVAGYPKSGTTWLTRLVGTALNSPTGGCMQKLDKTEPATELEKRDGEWIVRKGHYVLSNSTRSNKVVPTPHHLDWTNITDEKVIFIVRDPRDIAVSGSYHWSKKPGQFLMDMVYGINGVRLCGNWQKYVMSWTRMKRYKWLEIVRYEDLLAQPVDTLSATFIRLGIDYTLNNVRNAVKREDFNETRKRIENGYPVNLGKEFNLKLLRNGKSGDWVNYLSPEVNKLVLRNFKEAMNYYGYK